MTNNSIKHISYSASVIVHLILFALFLMITITMDYPANEYVELSFGTSGKLGSSGNVGEQISEVEERIKPEQKTETVQQNVEVKEVDLPVAKSSSEENIIQPSKDEKEETIQNKIETTEKVKQSPVTTTGQGNKAEGDGSFGFDIDWGGKGKRKIYSYSLPSYPEGVQKEIDIRLRFTILPDGTVGTIIPLIKADTKLENAAINSLRKWRFEALDQSQKQLEQAAIIVFPYRLQ